MKFSIWTVTKIIRVHSASIYAVFKSLPVILMIYLDIGVYNYDESTIYLSDKYVNEKHWLEPSLQ